MQERTRDLSSALADLKRAQGQLIESEKQAMLGRLVAGIVHEVNTPLGSLRSSADTLQRMTERVRAYLEGRADAGDDAARKLLEATSSSEQLARIVMDSSDRIADLVGSLKRFVGLDESERKAFDVREGIYSALTLLGPRLGDGITVTLDLPDQDTIVECYPARLNQVFLNLIDNAATAVDGHGTIHIRVQRVHGKIEVAVEDDGRGIDAERLDSLFEYGFTRKQGRMSMRMGLPSSKQTVEELGGQISIESARGRGTAVRVALPSEHGLLH